MNEMFWVTSENVVGKRIVKTLGGVRGNAIRTRHLGKDILAVLKSLIGGELRGYTALIAQTREQALDRMYDHARELGANGIVQVRFGTAEVMRGAAEIVMYGTAVILEDEVAED